MKPLAHAAALAAALLLAACGGGSPEPAPPPSGNDVPSAATASPTAFVTWTGEIPASDTREPLRVEGAMPPTSETEEPLPVT
jgi:ABC-type glycerol-3-phosphate transport system substrate-binding protein